MAWSEQELHARLQQALTYLQGKELQQAEAALREILVAVPDCSPAEYYLGTCLLQQEDRQAEGAALLEQMVAVQEEQVAPAVLINLGLYYYVTAEYGRSEAMYRRALVSYPDSADLHNKLACACHAQKRLPESAYHYQQALIREPNMLSAYEPLVGTLRNLKRWVEAYIWSERWLRAAPGLKKPLADRAVGFQDARLMKAAEQTIESLPEDIAELLFYRGSLAQFKRQSARSEQYYRRVLELDPDMAPAEFNLSMLLLGLGRFEEGWRKFDIRFHERAPLGPHGHKEPEWDGRPLGGDGILVHSEQGVGDVIQFMRFFPQIQKLGGRVIFSSYGDVLTLLKASDDAQVVTDVATLDLSYQWQIPLLTLGKVFANHESDMAVNVPYVAPPRDRAALWQERLAEDNGVKVGLVWAGNPEHGNDHNRSSELEDFQPLATVAGVSYYALQKGPTAAQAACPPAGLSLTALSDDISDFMDTAAIISALDLVICVDTSVAHLAGAMGKPVWLLIPDAADWRWLAGREDSPWYPSMRVFQRGVGETWGGVLARVAIALDAWCAVRPGDTAWLAERRAALLVAEERWTEAESEYAEALKGGISRRLAQRLAHSFQLRGSQLGAAFSAEQPYLAARLMQPSGVDDEQQLAYWQAQRALRFDADINLEVVEQLQALGHYQEAIDIARQTLAEQPQNWAVRYALAQCLRKSGDDVAAEPEYAAVLKISPRHPTAGVNRAMALDRLGKPTEALQQLQRTALCHPYHVKVRLYLAILLYQQRQFALALIVIEAHRQNWPEDSLSAFWHGALLRQMGQFESALEVLVRTTPNGEISGYEIQRELAYVKAALSRSEGIVVMQDLLVNAPVQERAITECLYGLQLLGAGRYAEGWQAYEARRRVLDSDTLVQKFPSAPPLWDGTPLNGRTLLIFCEQGYGDTLQFLRYIDEIQGHCILVYQDGLDELLASCYSRPNLTLVSRSSYRSTPVPADCHIDLMSLPHVLGLAGNLLGDHVPYLRSKAAGNLFEPHFSDEKRTRVGFVWAGNPKHLADHWRSIDLLKLAPLFSCTNVAWYSLQKGVVTNDVLLLPVGTPILNAASLSDNFYETLQIIDLLDLVITVDSALAHLAGAMGKPVWLLLPEQADWRWADNTELTAWYPSMRIFKQRVLGEWDEVVSRVVQALASYGVGDD